MTDSDGQDHHLPFEVYDIQVDYLTDNIVMGGGCGDWQYVQWMLQRAVIRNIGGGVDKPPLFYVKFRGKCEHFVKLL